MSTDECQGKDDGLTDTDWGLTLHAPSWMKMKTLYAWCKLMWMGKTQQTASSSLNPRTVSRATMQNRISRVNVDDLHAPHPSCSSACRS